jgi:hypothetical protein
MILEPLPGVKPVRLLAGSCVRKSPVMVAAFLDTLTHQLLPPNVVLDVCLIDDNDDPASSDLLRRWQADDAEHRLIEMAPDAAARSEYSDQKPQTHQWSAASMSRVGHLKNGLIQFACDNGYDGLWLLDADLLMGPRTLWSLYHTEAPVVCGVFWTQWQNEPSCPPLPQVWLRHPYQLDGRGWNSGDFLHALAARHRVEVWGQGACTLYRTEVFHKGVNYTTVPDLPTEGMWTGEDRHLCTRAERLHVPMIADAWPNIWHCYHPQQIADIPVWAERLAQEEPGHARLGDAVSLHLQAVEPVPQEGGGTVHIERQHVRGILGRLSLIEDVETAILTLARGESRMLSVLYPPWAKAAILRGQRRLIQVTLVDWMPAQSPIGLR